jgi:hypothetical protein
LNPNFRACHWYTHPRKYKFNSEWIGSSEDTPIEPVAFGGWYYVMTTAAQQNAQASCSMPREAMNLPGLWKMRPGTAVTCRLLSTRRAVADKLDDAVVKTILVPFVETFAAGALD